VAQGTLNKLKTGESQDIEVKGEYGKLTLTVKDAGGATVATATATCVELPSLSATGICIEGSSEPEATFKVTNTGGNILTKYTYEVKDAAGKVVASGNLNNLKTGESQDIQVKNVYGVLTLTVKDSSGATAATATATCVELPDIIASGICTGQNTTPDAMFTIKNKGGNMLKTYSYHVEDENGATIAGTSGTFKLKNGETLDVKVTGVLGKLTLVITDDTGKNTDAATMECLAPPDLVVVGVCTMDITASNPAVATFTITNKGGHMLTDYFYAITDAAGNVVDTNTFKLKAGESKTIKVSGNYTKLTLSIIDDREVEVTTSTASCNETIPPIEPAEPIICIQCLIFHTFRDGNLEIYRLDGYEGGTLTHPGNNNPGNNNQPNNSNNGSSGPSIGGQSSEETPYYYEETTPNEIQPNGETEGENPPKEED
jgi:hypothetical protein